jgi:protein TonB
LKRVSGKDENERYNRQLSGARNPISMSTAQASITPEDRLGFTLCLAIIVHATVILGVSFSPPKAPPANLDSIEVILVQESSEKAPEKADFLAQANLEGGGDAEKAYRPATPLHAPFPDTRAEIAATPTPADDPSPPQEPAKGEAESRQTSTSTELAAETHISERPRPRPERTPKPTAEVQKNSTSSPTPPSDAQLPNAETLISNSLAMASINAELQQRLEARAKRPRRKFISASTREHKFAAYMEAWRAKVERIGNLNYPDDARRESISGSLILDVAIKSDGAVTEITIRRPSGHKILDDAAIRIVHLASPYAPFPESIGKDIDILHITRTWQFLNSNQFISN